MHKKWSFQLSISSEALLKKSLIKNFIFCAVKVNKQPGSSAENDF